MHMLVQVEKLKQEADAARQIAGDALREISLQAARIASLQVTASAIS